MPEITTIPCGAERINLDHRRDHVARDGGVARLRSGRSVRAILFALALSSGCIGCDGWHKPLQSKGVNRASAAGCELTKYWNGLSVS